MRAYTLEYPKNLQHYLAGKKIFTLGHSCSRRWYFELKKLLGDEGMNLHMSRKQEVTEWGRGGVAGAQGRGLLDGMCGCSVSF